MGARKELEHFKQHTKSRGMWRSTLEKKRALHAKAALHGTCCVPRVSDEQDSQGHSVFQAMLHMTGQGMGSTRACAECTCATGTIEII